MLGSFMVLWPGKRGVRAWGLGGQASWAWAQGLSDQCSNQGLKKPSINILCPLGVREASCSVYHTQSMNLSKGSMSLGFRV